MTRLLLLLLLLVFVLLRCIRILAVILRLLFLLLRSCLLLLLLVRVVFLRRRRPQQHSLHPSSHGTNKTTQKGPRSLYSTMSTGAVAVAVAVVSVIVGATGGSVRHHGYHRHCHI